MSKPLTIDELKALPVGDWVWVEVLNVPNSSFRGYYQIRPNTERSKLIFCGIEHDYSILDYGKTWLAYKNKEFADSKGKWVELPCKKGDTMYWVYSRDQKEPISFIAENISGKILDDGEWRFFAFNRYGYGGACGVIDGRWYLGKDKSEAERRLAELRGEK